MQTILNGIVTAGYQIASGGSVGQEGNPFPESSLKMQARLFRAQGIDLEALVPGLAWATINLKLDRELVLGRADHVARGIDWTDGLTGEARIGPETFSFVHCCFVYPPGGEERPSAYYPGLIYYPHPETKPSVNDHHFDVLEIMAGKIPGLVHGTPAAVVLRADAFRPR